MIRLSYRPDVCCCTGKVGVRQRNTGERPTREGLLEFPQSSLCGLLVYGAAETSAIIDGVESSVLPTCSNIYKMLALLQDG